MVKAWFTVRKACCKHVSVIEKEINATRPSSTASENADGSTTVELRNEGAGPVKQVDDMCKPRSWKPSRDAIRVPAHRRISSNGIMVISLKSWSQKYTRSVGLSSPIGREINCQLSVCNHTSSSRTYDKNLRSSPVPFTPWHTQQSDVMSPRVVCANNSPPCLWPYARETKYEATCGYKADSMRITTSPALLHNAIERLGQMGIDGKAT